jgi:nucleoside-diphosphate-sugar epimerase
MEMIAVRPTVGYGATKFAGGLWFVQVAAWPAMGQPEVLASRADQEIAMIHVDDEAETLVRLCWKDTLHHHVYYTGGDTCSATEMAQIVKEVIPEAQFSFDENSRDMPLIYLIDNYLIDSSRVVEATGIRLLGPRERPHSVIDRVRAAL